MHCVIALFLEDDLIMLSACKTSETCVLYLEKDVICKSVTSARSANKLSVGLILITCRESLQIDASALVNL